ncbi:FAD/FMN-containing dehydrogenase [Paraburkholderia steynii]|uniref:FAD/FMN-containing dehydrogenase n=1 Tax=Paraburkholderia steynii TaxID=1245441 RepID=A0A7Z7FEY5_9BURK|nr:FAD/FMN-containing dehydrogenase [Paraburkholderia steynii]
MHERLLSKLVSCGCRGPVIGRDHPDYDNARRVWNGLVDRRPAAILQAESVDDVRRAIDSAAQSNALLAVRGGGHSIPGLSTCDDGLVLDLSRLNSVVMDKKAGTVDVGGGALLGNLDQALVPKGKVVPAGVISHTGVAGLTLGGGMGRLSRAFGLTIDHLAGVQIVTADGAVNWIDIHSDPELFWGVRGGGGNFGIVTRFRFKLCPLGPVMVGQWNYPIRHAKEAIGTLDELARSRPREFSVAFTLTSSSLSVTAVWVGDIAHAEQMLGPFGRLAQAGQGSIAHLPFVQLQSCNDHHFAWCRRYYAKGGFWRSITSNAIDTMLREVEAAPTPDSEFYVLQLGGAVADVPEDATAYSGRQAACYWIAEPVWDDPADDERCIAWGRAAATRISDQYIQANYVNEQGDTAIAPGAYGARKYERLARLKARCDPANLFRLNQNIVPFPRPASA